jgi:hypothetical protein
VLILSRRMLSLQLLLLLVVRVVVPDFRVGCFGIDFGVDCFWKSGWFRYLYIVMLCLYKILSISSSRSVSSLQSFPLVVP